MGSSKISGTVSGDTPGGGDVVSAVVHVLTATHASVVIADRAGYCDDLAAGIQRKGDRLLVITMRDNGAAPTMPEGFHVGPTDATAMGFVTWVQLDDNCNRMTLAGAGGGSITLDAVDGDVFRGSFDVMFGSLGHLSGTFSPSACPGLSAAEAGDPPLMCK